MSLSIFKRLKRTEIVRVFSLNALATLIRMLCGMVSIKVVAVIIGPSGVALLGQLKNLESILLGVANGGINNGITKYIAEYKDDDQQVKKYISNAFRITLYASLIIAILLIVGCEVLSEIVLLSEEYYYVFIVFGFTILLYTLNMLLVSILNGFKQFKKYVIVNISGTIFGLIYSIILVFFWGLPGAMINTVTYQSVVLFLTLWLCRKLPWFNIQYFKESLDKKIVKRYLGYSLMTITSLALVPVVRMILRGYVITEISSNDAGIWEGMNSISSISISVITTAFSIYYLPRLSEIKENNALHNEIIKCFKVMLPIMIVISLTIYLLRHFILWLLFTPAFYDMEKLFIWQLGGDFFKICSWLLAYIMVAKAQTLRYIATEVFFNISYLIISFLFLKYNGIVGLTQGYLVNYIIYMLIMILIFRNVINNKRNGNTKIYTITKNN